MNNTLTFAHNILMDILEKDLPFGLAIAKATKGKHINPELRANSFNLLGCALRHYVVFDELIFRAFGEIPTRVRSGLFLILANRIFIKVIDENEANEFARQKFIDENINITDEAFNKILEASSDKQKLVPQEFDPNSIEFLSCRFNTPIWLVKMWKKQFGPRLIYPILSANGRGAASFYRLNESKNKMNDFLSNNSVFQQNKHLDGVLEYTGKKSDKKNVIKNCGDNIFECTLGIKKLFDIVDTDPIRGIAFYSGVGTNAYLELVARFSNNVQFDLMTKPGEAYFTAKNIIESYGMSGVSLYETEASSMITCVSRPVHTFFVLPENSNFVQIRNTPDYLYHFKQDCFDSLLESQKIALEEASNLVEDGGTLVYAVTTMNHKEGKAQVISFLNRHSDYVLVEDRQMFPFDKMDSVLYYAILKKVEKQ